MHHIFNNKLIRFIPAKIEEIEIIKISHTSKIEEEVLNHINTPDIHKECFACDIEYTCNDIVTFIVAKYLKFTLCEDCSEKLFAENGKFDDLLYENMKDEVNDVNAFIENCLTNKL